MRPVRRGAAVPVPGKEPLKSGGGVQDVTAAILFHGGKVLIARRASGGVLARRWEFPGGKVEPGETPEACLRREMQEEFRIDVQVGAFVGESVFRYDHATIRLLAYRATWTGGTLRPVVHEACRWVRREELDHFEFSAADRPFVALLKQHPDWWEGAASEPCAGEPSISPVKRTARLDNK